MIVRYDERRYGDPRSRVTRVLLGTMGGLVVAFCAVGAFDPLRDRGTYPRGLAEETATVVKRSEHHDRGSDEFTLTLAFADRRVDVMFPERGGVYGRATAGTTVAASIWEGEVARIAVAGRSVETYHSPRVESVLWVLGGLALGAWGAFGAAVRGTPASRHLFAAAVGLSLALLLVLDADVYEPAWIAGVAVVAAGVTRTVSARRAGTVF